MAKGKGYVPAYPNTWELPQRIFTIRRKSLAFGPFRNFSLLSVCHSIFRELPKAVSRALSRAVSRAFPKCAFDTLPEAIPVFPVQAAELVVAQAEEFCGLALVEPGLAQGSVDVVPLQSGHGFGQADEPGKRFAGCLARRSRGPRFVSCMG